MADLIKNRQLRLFKQVYFLNGASQTLNKYEKVLNEKIINVQLFNQNKNTP